MVPHTCIEEKSKLDMVPHTCIEEKSPEAHAPNMAAPNNTDSVTCGMIIGKPETSKKSVSNIP